MIAARRHLILCALGALLAGAPASADVSGPDDSLAQAYPLQPGVTVSGAFNSPTDVDYLSFSVAAPNTAVHFTVTNTTPSCSSPDGPAGCAVWGTLIDGQQQQLGGEGSSAGTAEVDAGKSDVIDWTIATPGTYYLAMDSGGSLPSYQVRLSPQATAITLLAARSVRHGAAVRATVKAGQALQALKARLTLTRHGKTITIGRASRSVSAGTVTLTVAVNRTGRRALARAAHHRLLVRLTLTAVPAAGPTATVRRSLTLHR